MRNGHGAVLWRGGARWPPPEAGTRSGRSRSRRTCAACRCRRALGRPQASPRSVSWSCRRTAAIPALRKADGDQRSCNDRPGAAQTRRADRGAGPFPFFVTIELARTTMAPARRRPARPCLGSRVQSTSAEACLPSDVAQCAMQSVDLLHTLISIRNREVALLGTRWSLTAVRLHCIASSMHTPGRRGSIPCECMQKFCSRTHDFKHQGTAEASGLVAHRGDELDPGVSSASTMNPSILRSIPASRVPAIDCVSCEAQQRTNLAGHARQHGCLPLPPPCMPASSAARLLTPIIYRQSLTTAATSAPDLSASSQTADAPEDVPSAANSDHGSAATRWHPFAQPALWEGTEADALQPGSRVLDLAPPWRVRALAESAGSSQCDP